MKAQMLSHQLLKICSVLNDKYYFIQTYRLITYTSPVIINGLGYGKTINSCFTVV